MEVLPAKSELWVYTGPGRRSAYLEQYPVCIGNRVTCRYTKESSCLWNDTEETAYLARAHEGDGEILAYYSYGPEGSSAGSIVNGELPDAAAKPTWCPGLQHQEEISRGTSYSELEGVSALLG